MFHVLFDEGALSGKRSFKRTERELAGPGRPGTADEAGGQGGAPGGAAPYVTGRARSHCAARGGSVNPASKGASQAPWRLPPLHRLARVFREGLQTSDALRRENAEARLFEIVDRKFAHSAGTNSASSPRR